MSCTFDIEAADPIIDQMSISEDFQGMSFRIVPSDGRCGARVHVSPFEMARLITRLSELHLFVQSKLVEAQLGAPSSGLKAESYQVDPSLTSQSVQLRLRPRGTDTASLSYTLPTDMARKIAHELLSAADEAESRPKPLPN
jgi:hypothetical protein